MEKRNYSLAGPEGEKARARGLVEAEWYTCEISRQELKRLMIRKDAPALRDIIIWFVALGFLGYLLYISWGSWWILPTLIAYSVVYSVPAVSKWHEFSHGTPFKTDWLNESMYQLTSFMIMIQATLFRWSHVRHHTDTIIVGRDREILAERPPNWREVVIGFTSYKYIWPTIKGIYSHAIGSVDEEEKRLIPSSAYRKLFWEARIWVMIYFAIIIWCILAKTFLPLMFIGFVPKLFGNWVNHALVVTQHGGLAEDVLDHRLNTRTFYTNPILQFLYSNMNYHVEHHMFPMVPYYNLPKLHQLIKHDCPTVYPSFWSAFREGLSAIYRQRKEPSYLPERPLPSTARPFRFGPMSASKS